MLLLLKQLVPLNHTYLTFTDRHLGVFRLLLLNILSSNHREWNSLKEAATKEGFHSFMFLVFLLRKLVTETHQKINNCISYLYPNNPLHHHPHHPPTPGTAIQRRQPATVKGTEDQFQKKCKHISRNLIRGWMDWQSTWSPSSHSTQETLRKRTQEAMKMSCHLGPTPRNSYKKVSWFLFFIAFSVYLRNIHPHGNNIIH